MIDKDYLDKFGEKRFQTFSFGENITNVSWELTPEASIDMEFLKQHNHLPEWDSYLYKVFSSVERVYRIDFHSKYYFHSASPTAKNIPSVKLVMLFRDHLYSLNPLLDKIVISKNNLIGGVNSDKVYFFLIADDRKLQRDYGEFYKMLSLLNIGHALLNVEVALTSEGVNYQSYDKAYLLVNEIPFLSIARGVELLQPEKSTHIACTARLKESQRLYDSIKCRTADQSTSGDVFLKETLKKACMEEFLSLLKERTNQNDVKISIYINDVEGYESGYYRYESDTLVKVRKAINQIEPNRILASQQSYTNVTGLNMWVFFHFDKHQNQQSYDQKFVDIGYIAQYISLLISKWGRASRGMKNYKDSYLKERFNIPKKEFLGYSLMIFPPSHSGHTSFIED
ncbi:hypothetical protein KQI49_11120 [Virgibacillus sp. MSJ-26]|uniref:hypothetical protein n=1 Tax=Virgibacillus sp. MSJ-26 TaxID=2841522 RepID=UPI001C121310|nr:hypothetical protein [Virgibacillus sp. MSJ-26]MBU5467372.1 hypothetical protein [Virgibacillus sp. MSJ-26]